MKAALILFAAAILSMTALASADAKGCIKGALVGGVAGHLAGHHGFAGAVAGCAIGRHEANKQAGAGNAAQQTPTSPPRQ
jgi:hypothetical protein